MGEVAPHEDGSPRFHAFVESFDCTCPLDLPDSATEDERDDAYYDRRGWFEARALAAWRAAKLA